MNGAHHLKADIIHLYLPRHLVQTGFVSLLDVVECEKRSLSYYLHGATKSLLCYARDILQIPIMGGEDDYVTEARQQQLLQCKGKVLPGEFLKKVANVGEISLSFKWLLYGCLKMPTCRSAGSGSIRSGIGYASSTAPYLWDVCSFEL